MSDAYTSLGLVSLCLLLLTGQNLAEFLFINVHIYQFYSSEQTITGHVLGQFGQVLSQENELVVDKNVFIQLQDPCQ